MSAVLSPVDDDFPRDREVAQLRTLNFVPNYTKHAEGSVLAALARRQRGRVATFDQAFAAAHADVVEVLPG